jgi:hypothetical protein
MIGWRDPKFKYHPSESHSNADAFHKRQRARMVRQKVVAGAIALLDKPVHNHRSGGKT